MRCELCGVEIKNMEAIAFYDQHQNYHNCCVSCATVLYSQAPNILEQIHMIHNKKYKSYKETVVNAINKMLSLRDSPTWEK